MGQSMDPTKGPLLKSILIQTIGRPHPERPGGRPKKLEGRPRWRPGRPEGNPGRPGGKNPG